MNEDEDNESENDSQKELKRQFGSPKLGLGLN